MRHITIKTTLTSFQRTCGFLALLGVAYHVAAAAGQCQVANPSFELLGYGGQVFLSWNQINTVQESTSFTAHGQLAARLQGPNSGDWDVSGVWQALDTAPGERWDVAVRAGYRSADPLNGDARGIVNVEWRDTNGALIDYESHDAVLPTTTPDIMHRVEFETAPAPAGTVETRILLAFLQSPANETGAVYFDHVQFRGQDSPTLTEIQWNDFPGGRTLDFGGRSWRVKGPGLYGPGFSQFGDSAEFVWVDLDGRLHMTIRNVSGTWYSTEITLEEPLVYGDYIFTTVGRLDTLAPNVVLGLFTWQYPLCFQASNPWNLHNEFDVEISRWGDPGNDVGQFVAQPYNYAGNITRFAVNFTSDDQLTSFAFRILPDRVVARSWYGGPYDEAAATMVYAWTYTGPHVPMPEIYRVHINLWQLNGPPSNGLDQEVILNDFQFVPACDDDPTGNDWRCMSACLSGPSAPGLRSCDAFDRDGDEDVDLADLADYQQAFATP